MLQPLRPPVDGLQGRGAPALLPPPRLDRSDRHVGVAKYVGLDGASVGIDRFGMSAPGAQVMTELGITVDHLIETVKSLS